MSRSGNYSMLTQTQQRLKAAGKDPDNVSLLSRETGLCRDTVRKYLQQGVQPHGSKGKRKPSKLDDWHEYLQQQFACRNFNCESLLQRLKERGYTGGITILREYVRRFRPEPEKASAPERTMRFETVLGEQAQMDWGFVHYRGAKDGKMKLLACLVMILGTSRMRHVEFFGSARQENLFIGMIHAFQYFGGLPKTVLTDNMKSVVQSRTKPAVVFNPKYEAFMAELGFATRLCKVRTPQTKGKSERLVDYVKNNFFPGREFSNLVDLNVQGFAWCELVNGQVHGTTGLIPKEIHGQERRHLKSLPSQQILDRYLWIKRSVSSDGLVSYGGCKFGIVHSCREKEVRISSNNGMVLVISSEGELVGSHTVTGRQRMYYHPQQWTEGYIRVNGRGRRPVGFGIQTENMEDLPEGPADLSVYDTAAGGGF